MKFRTWARRIGPAVAGLALLAGCRSALIPGLERFAHEPEAAGEADGAAAATAARTRYEGFLGQDRLTLAECFDMALFRSENLALDGEELARIQSRYEELVGGLRPQVSLRGSYTRQDPGGGSGGDGSASPGGGGVVGGSSGGGGSSSPQRADIRLHFTQAIFSGFRDTYGKRRLLALRGAREREIEQARHELYLDVADAFFTILELDRELSTTQDTLKLAEERLEELKEREKAGLARRSEVLAQEAAAAAARARVEGTRGAVEVAREAFAFVTGASGARTLAEAKEEARDLRPLPEYLSRAETDRNDLKALKEEIRAAEENVSVVRGQYRPSVSLEGNVYPYRHGSQRDQDWDVTLTAEMPILSWGRIREEVRQAESELRSARLRLERRRREIARDLGGAHADIKSLASEAISREKEVESAEALHEAARAEYGLGLATNLEVLTALNALETARLERDRVRFRLKLSRLRLEIGSGAAPPP